MTFTPRRPNPVFGEDYAALRGVLKAARRRAGLSQRTLGARLGKCQSHINMIERGQRRVDTLELYFIARALELNPSDLFAEIVTALEGRTSDHSAAAADARPAQPRTP